MVITLSIQESHFDAFLHDEDEHQLSLGLEQSIVVVEALQNVPRDQKWQLWQESERRERPRKQAEANAMGGHTDNGSSTCGMQRQRQLSELEQDQQAAKAGVGQQPWR